MASIRRVSNPGRPTFRKSKPGRGFGNARPGPKPVRSVGRKGTSLNPGPKRTDQGMRRLFR